MTGEQSSVTPEILNWSHRLFRRLQVCMLYLLDSDLHVAEQPSCLFHNSDVLRAGYARHSRLRAPIWGRPHQVLFLMSAVEFPRFEPAMKDGKPVAVQINVDVNFNLHEKELNIRGS
jgi:hypothetical protein